MKLMFNSSRADCNQVTLTPYQAFHGVTGAGLDFQALLNQQGVKLVVRDGSASGAILHESTDYKADPITITESATHKYYISVTNGCGTEFNHILDLSSQEVRQEPTTAVFTGCAPDDYIEYVVSAHRGWKMPLTVTIKTRDNTETVGSQIITDHGGFVTFKIKIPYTDVSDINSYIRKLYKVVYDDGCVVTEKNLPNNRNAEPTVVVYDFNGQYQCYDTGNPHTSADNPSLPPLTETGSRQVEFTIDNYFPGMDQATFKIISGPNGGTTDPNVGTYAWKASGGRYWYSNLEPGTYQVEAKGGDCAAKTINLVVPATHLLEQSVSATAVTACNGGGTISFTKQYANGPYPTAIELWKDGQLVTETNADQITGLEPGTYQVRMKVKVTSCGGTNNPSQYDYYMFSDVVTLGDQLPSPKLKVYGLVCEVGNGAPIGRIYLKVEGVQPYTIEYKKVGEAAYTTHLTDFTGTSTYIHGLEVNQVYNVRVSDYCGKVSNINVSVRTAGEWFIETETQPCYNAPYTLAGEDFQDTTYEWYKRDASGSETLLSNERVLKFTNYTPAHDGEYVLKMTWGSCLFRTIVVPLDGSKCGQPLRTAKIRGTLFHDNDDFDPVDGTPIQRANNQLMYVSLVQNGSVIKIMQISPNGTYEFTGVSNGDYQVVITNAPAGGTTSTLPDGWFNTGESVLSVYDGVPDGILDVRIQLATDVTDANFGIDELRACHNPVTNTSAGIPVKHGITLLKRTANSNTDTNNWPLNRNSAYTVLESNTKGFVVTRVTTLELASISVPQEGMMVYDTTAKCLKIYSDGEWKCFSTPSCP